ncbi:hypothetical protein F4818DRAFT_14525 [Hypoxylon cercidicola]|nr:hypothetical protein F4818DRAFT_14525 [Hypoxylon cercidicola]
MDVSQLPNVDRLLVTADNPPRAPNTLEGMDYERCAALHNYLVKYAWVYEGRPLARLNGTSFFTSHGAAAEALRPRLHPSLACFLATAVIPNDPEPAPFFFWASGLSDPEIFFAHHVADSFNMPEDSIVCLYYPNVGQGGEFGAGLFYHQGYHRAAVFMHTDDFDYALPVEAHPSLWHPLETVLSNWIGLLRLGKIKASPRDTPSVFGSEKIGPWEWWPYSDAQVDACVCAWDRLCDAIEARVLPLLPPTSATTNVVEPEPEPEPLITPSTLDAASVPEPCFARAFLSRARRPRFRYIAPGLILPHAGVFEFAASQRFTMLPHNPQVIPPVCLFPADRDDLQADLTESLSSFSIKFHMMSASTPVPSRVPAGVYSELMGRNAYDTAEEGFRLLLPYCLGGDVWNASADPRKSDGSFIDPRTVDSLFQHGYKPFGGDYYRPQRLERLWDHWRKLVDEGIWSVGPQGVEGTIDTFKQAADTAHWRDYLISPTW